MTRRPALALFAAAALLAACSTPPTPAKHSALYATESALGTDSGNDMAYHTVVHYPTEHALRYPGLIIGVEKSAAPLLAEGRSLDALRPLDPASKSDQWLAKKLTSDSKLMFISHIVSTAGDAASPYATPTPCFLYNVYTLPAGDADIGRKKMDDTAPCTDSAAATGKPYSDSWNAIAQARATIARELARKDHRYTHVVVIVMGWNTEQIESVQNFNSLTARLASTVNADMKSDAPFAPYVIGVTWPSEWHSAILDTAAKLVSLPNKANDADELGAGWLGAIVDQAVLPGAQAWRAADKPVIVIGHSFGARATSHAVCRPSMLRAPPGLGAASTASVDWLIALEGAYSLNRFAQGGAGAYDLNYPGQCARASHLLFTASNNDVAAAAGGIILAEGHFAGTHKTYVTAAADGLDDGKLTFRTYKADSRGKLTLDCGKAINLSSRLLYVDATETIYYNAYGTGAGAHSDVYRNDTAHLIWNAIADSATCPTKQPM